MKATRQGLGVSFSPLSLTLTTTNKQQSPNGIREGEFLALDSFGCHTTPSQPSCSDDLGRGSEQWRNDLAAEGGEGQETPRQKSPHLFLGSGLPPVTVKRVDLGNYIHLMSADVSGRPLPPTLLPTLPPPAPVLDKQDAYANRPERQIILWIVFVFFFCFFSFLRATNTSTVKMADGFPLSLSLPLSLLGGFLADGRVLLRRP